LSSTRTEAGAHATNALCRGRARDARRRTGCARLDLAGGRSRPASVLDGPGSVRRRSASRHRHRRAHGNRGSRAGERSRLVRGHAPAGRSCDDDPDDRRLCGHAAAARRDAGRTGRRGRGGRSRGPQRPECRPREHRAPRSPGSAARRRPGGLRRSPRAVAGAGSAAGPRAGARAGARARGRRDGAGPSGATGGAGRGAGARRAVDSGARGGECGVGLGSRGRADRGIVVGTGRAGARGPPRSGRHRHRHHRRHALGAAPSAASGGAPAGPGACPAERVPAAAGGHRCSRRQELARGACSEAGAPCIRQPADARPGPDAAPRSDSARRSRPAVVDTRPGHDSVEAGRQGCRAQPQALAAGCAVPRRPSPRARRRPGTPPGRLQGCAYHS
jgi:hypothetical protein